MAFGKIVTSFLANLYPSDSLAPNVIGDFAHLYAGTPKGDAVSDLAAQLHSADPVHHANIGPSVSDYIQTFHVGDPGPGDSGFLLL